MSLIVGAAAAAVAVVAVSFGAVALGRKGVKAEARERLEAGGLTNEQGQALKEAKRSLHDSRSLAYNIANQGLRDQALKTIAAAEKLLKAFGDQPEEIRRANQYFSYYVPTINVVLRKYRSLAESGTLEDDQMLHKTEEHLVDMQAAFEQLYENMFKDEVLDLTVEVEAMQMSLKRDGLA